MSRFFFDSTGVVFVDLDEVIHVGWKAVNGPGLTVKNVAVITLRGFPTTLETNEAIGDQLLAALKAYRQPL